MLQSVVVRRAALLLAISLGLISAAIAEDNPLRMIPANNAVVIRIRQPALALDKVASLINQFQLEFAPFGDDEKGTKWSDMLAVATPLVSAEQFGIDIRRDWWMYMANPFSEEAACTFILPLNDLDKFQSKRAETDKTPFFVHNDWILIGRQDELDAVKKSIEGTSDSIEGRMTQEARAVFDQGDVGVMIDIRHLIATNLMGLVAAPEILKLMIEGGNFAFTDKQVENVARKLIDSTFQSIAALDLATISINLSDDDIQIEQFVDVREKSPLDGLFQNNPGSDMSLLNSLPESSGVYVGLHGNWKSFFHGLIELMKSTAPQDQYAMRDAQVGLMSEYEKLNYGSIAFAYPMRPADEGLLRSITLFEVDQPDRIRTLAAQAEEFGDALGPIRRISASRSTETFGEHTVRVRHLGPVVQIQQNGVPAPDVMSDIDVFLYGPDGNVERSIYLNDRVVQFNGGTKARSAASLQQVRSAVKSNSDFPAQFLETRNKLGEKPNAVMLIDGGTVLGSLLSNSREFFFAMAYASALLVPFMDDVTDSMRMATEQEVRVDPAKLERLYENPSYVGFSLTFEPHAARLKTVVPIESLKRVIQAARIVVSSIAESPERGAGRGANGYQPATDPEDE